MSKHRGFIYHLCAITGWTLILLGGLGLLFVIIASGSSEKKLPTLMITGGAIVAGVLIAMIAERNIFRALGTAIDHMFIVFWP